MPGDPGATVVTNARAFYTTRAAAGATGTRHSPRPLWGGGYLNNSGATRREIADVYLDVIAFHDIACDKREAFAQGSESDEAIHSSFLLLHGLLRLRSQ
jgi:hypothetical protein